MSKKNGTKLCKHCKTEIPADAKVCPNCRKNQGGIIKWIVIGIVVIAVIGSLGGGGEEKTSTDKTDKKEGSASVESTSAAKEDSSDEKAEVQEQIEYTPCTVNDMINDLENNAMNASDKYKDQYIEVTGKLSNIDSSGKYISLYPDDDFAIIGVQCYIKNDEQKQVISKMSKGDTVTLKGKCTDVGEVLGYSLDIDSIE